MAMANKDVEFANEVLPYLTNGQLPPGDASNLIRLSVNSVIDNADYEWTAGDFETYFPLQNDAMDFLVESYLNVSQYQEQLNQAIIETCNVPNQQDALTTNPDSATTFLPTSSATAAYRLAITVTVLLASGFQILMQKM